MWRSITNKLRGVAAIFLFVGIGWFAHAEAGLLHIGGQEAAEVAPDFVTDAIIARRTEQLRRQMNTQSHYQTYDPAEIEARLNIRIPPLPADWAVSDVQIFPSHEGGSVEASISAASLGRISMFAVRRNHRVQPPAVASDGTETTIYWQSGHRP